MRNHFRPVQNKTRKTVAHFNKQTSHVMPFLDAINIATASGRAHRALMKAQFFAIGPIGSAARISTGERALLRILREPAATAMLLELLSRASLPGQLYVLLGLRHLGYEGVEHLFKKYREQTDEVPTQTGCLRGSHPFCSVVARIQDGTYSSLLEAHDKG
jgi:hypothetical protein